MVKILAENTIISQYTIVQYCKIAVVQTGYLTREELKLRLLLEVTCPGVGKDDKSTRFPVSV
jgi:hypothetical protein